MVEPDDMDDFRPVLDDIGLWDNPHCETCIHQYPYSPECKECEDDENFHNYKTSPVWKDSDTVRNL